MVGLDVLNEKEGDQGGDNGEARADPKYALNTRSANVARAERTYSLATIGSFATCSHQQGFVSRVTFDLPKLSMM